MKTSPANRMQILLALLAATGLAIVFAPPPEEEAGIVAPAARAVARAPVVVPAQSSGMAYEAQVLRLRPRSAARPPRGLFEAPAVPVAVAVPVAAQAPVPMPPPLPFRVLGSYREGDAVTVFLDDKGDGIAVTVGDTLHGETYRIDAITEEQIQFTYMPLQQKQSLALGDAP